MAVILAAIALAIVYGWRPVAGLWAHFRALHDFDYSPNKLFLSFAVTASQLVVVGWIFRKDLRGILIGEETTSGLIVKSALAIALVLGVDFACARIGSAGLNPDSIQKSRKMFDTQVITQSGSPWFWIYCLLAATTEELLFRGAPLFRVHSVVAIILVTTISSGAFAAQHLRSGVSHLGYKFIFGVSFSVQFLLFGQLAPVIVGHLAGNWRILFAARRIPASSDHKQQLQHSALRM